MSELKGQQIKNALEKQVQEIEKTFLRKMQKEMFECSAMCCSQMSVSTAEVNLCLERCSLPLNQSHDFVNVQLDNYQTRLQRCVNQCNDEAKDHLGLHPSPFAVNAASKQFEECACSCIDKHIDLLPKFVKTIHEMLNDKMATKNPNSASPSVD